MKKIIIMFSLCFCYLLILNLKTIIFILLFTIVYFITNNIKNKDASNFYAGGKKEKQKWKEKLLMKFTKNL